MNFKPVTQILYHKKCIFYQIQLNITHVIYYGAIILESNTLGQGIGSVVPTQHLCSRIKSSFIHKKPPYTRLSASDIT